MLTVKQIIEALIKFGLTQKEIERRSGVPQSAISRLLGGGQEDVVYTHGKRLEILLGEVQEEMALLAKKAA